MHAGIRVASLAVSDVVELRLDKTWAGVRETVAVGGWLREESVRLSDELYGAIGAPANAPVRSHLVALRRAVFNGRRLGARLWNAQTQELLPAGLGGRIAAWDERHRARDQLLRELPALMADEAAVVDLRLRRAVAARAFQYGLVVGSPTLFEELTKWLDDAPDAVPARQTVLRLAKYLLRVVTKTSPYSTFTLSGLLAFRDGDEPLRPTGTFEWTSVAELNLWLVRRVTAAATRHPTVWASQVLRVNPSLSADGDTIRFLSEGAERGPGGTGSVLVSMRRSRALDACVRLVAENAGATTAGETCRHLQAIDPELDEREVAAYVAKLVDVGLLNPRPPYGEQDADHLGTLATWLAQRGEPALAPLAVAVRELHADLRGYPELTDPRERLRRAHRIVERLGSALGVESDGTAGPLPRKNLFYENAVFTQPVVELGESAWAPVLADLGALRPVLGLFDPCRPAREALGRVFVATFGAGRRVGWVDFYQAVSRLTAAGGGATVAGVDGATLRTLCAGPALTPPRRWRELPFARDQAALTDAVGEAVRRRGTDDAGVVRLTPGELDDLTGPFHRSVGDSLTCYVQIVDRERPLRVVLNAVSSGYGRGRTRTARVLRQAGVEPPTGQAPAVADPDGAVLMETAAAFDSNLNLRAPGTRFELDYPFTAPTRPPEDRIAVSDLEVVHDPGSATLQLWSRRHGHRLRPVHGGLMAEMWMPAPVRHLIEVFGASPTLLHASTPLFLPSGDDPSVAGTGFLPRVEVGRVTLTRRCWALPATAMPLRDGGESDVAFWVRFGQWLADRGIPERFFVRVFAAVPHAAGWRDLRSRKPMYVDAAIWYSVALLERAVVDAEDLVVVTEALPELSGAPSYGPDGHVTELTVELDAVDVHG